MDDSTEQTIRRASDEILRQVTRDMTAEAIEQATADLADPALRERLLASMSGEDVAPDLVSVQPRMDLGGGHARVREVQLVGRGVGYIYAPYFPVHFVDCRPWWRAMWGLTWWRNLWDRWRAPWRRRRSWQTRYAQKRVDPSKYRRVQLGGEPKPPASD